MYILPVKFYIVHCPKKELHVKIDIIIWIFCRTTEKSYFAESRHLCRELSSRLSAKSFLCRGPRHALGKGLFAESRMQAFGKEALCREQHTRQRRALGKVPVHQTPAAGVPFAESLPFGSRQRKALCRAPAGKAFGKAIFAELSCLALGKVFFFVFCAEFFWCFVSLLQTIF